MNFNSKSYQSIFIHTWIKQDMEKKVTKRKFQIFENNGQKTKIHKMSLKSKTYIISFLTTTYFGWANYGVQSCEETIFNLDFFE